MDITQRRELAGRLLDGYVHGPAAATQATARALAKAATAEAVVLVEGVSDQIAVETLAVRRGRDLGTERVVVLPTGGAHGFARYLRQFGPAGAGLRLRACAMPARRTSSGAAWPALVSARPKHGPTWSDWASASAWRIWRTS